MQVIPAWRSYPLPRPSDAPLTATREELPKSIPAHPYTVSIDQLQKRSIVLLDTLNSLIVAPPFLRSRPAHSVPLHAAATGHPTPLRSPGFQTP